MALALFASDVIMPPTLVIDFLYLGFPVGLAAGVAIVAAVIAVYRRVRRGGRGRAYSALMGALVLAACNLAIYMFWLSFLHESPSRRHFRETAPVESAAPEDAGR